MSKKKKKKKKKKRISTTARSESELAAAHSSRQRNTREAHLERSGRIAQTTAGQSRTLGQRGTFDAAAGFTITSKVMRWWSLPRAGWQHGEGQLHEMPSWTSTFFTANDRDASTRSMEDPDLWVGTCAWLRMARPKSPSKKRE